MRIVGFASYKNKKKQTKPTKTMVLFVFLVLFGFRKTRSVF